MLQTLLWRCPICKTQDALQQTERRFRNDYVDCKNCQAHWELIRVIGGPNHRMCLILDGKLQKEMDLAEWYDEMMEDFDFVEINHKSWPIPEITLPDERLFLHAHILRCMASPEAVRSMETNERTKKDGIQTPFGLQSLGPGQLFFTSKQLLFIASNSDIAPLSFAWKDLRNADAMMDFAIGTSFGEWSFIFIPKDQSVLKWMAHFHLIAHGIQDKIDHEIYLGYI